MTLRWRLFGKYAFFIIALVSAALLASGGVSVYFSYRENQEHLVTLQREKALAAATRIEQYISDIEHQLGWTALPQVGAGGNVIEQRRYEYLKLLRQVPAITEVAWLDATGREQLRVSRLAMDAMGTGADLSQDAKFLEAKSGKTWYSPVYFRKETEPYMTISRPAGGRGSGITVAEVNLKFVWEVVSRIQIGKAGLAYVVNSNGTLIAHPDISLVLQKTDLSRLPHVTARIRDEGEVESIARNLKNEEVLTAHARIPTLGWTVFVELPLAEAFAPLYASILRAGLLLVAGLVLSILVSVYLARRMVTPIRALQEGAERIGAGQLDQRIDVHTGDELEALAERFNSMAAQLKESYAGLERKVEERTRELSESLEQQTATAEILRVISSSPTDTQPVFDAIAESAARLCGGLQSWVMRFDGELSHLVSHSHVTSDIAEFWDREFASFRPERKWITTRAILTGAVVHIPDVEQDPEYDHETARKGQYRSALSVPLLQDGRVIGAVAVSGRDPGPFPDSQITLLQTFADQAVIAIENVRLFNETKEALEQQTATAEILKVISSSPTDTQPVFDAIVKTGVRLFGGLDVGLRLINGDQLQLAASTSAFDADNVISLPLDDRTAGSRAAIRREVINIPDYPMADWVSEENRGWAKRRGFRAIVSAPMVRDGNAIGTITVTRATPGPFTDKEVALLKTFADQAVIAIENVRLFKELQARNAEITEALEQQTATAEILRIISTTPTDVTPVLEAVARRAAQLCESRDVRIHIVEGDVLRYVTGFGDVPTTQAPTRSLTRGRVTGRAVIDRTVMHIEDVTALPEEEYPEAREAQRQIGHRTMLAVPLLREDKAFGVIVMRRKEVRPFTPKQIELVKTFADQAVIAIENVRLFKELQARNADLTEALEQQTATAQILRVISSSPTDIRPVFDAILENATRLCGAQMANLGLYDGELFQDVAQRGVPPALSKFLLDRGPHRFSSDSGIGRMIAERQPVQFEDLKQGSGYRDDRNPNRVVVALVDLGGVRTFLAVPMLKEGRIVGGIVVFRREVRPFTQKQIDLVSTFASQAVIAIENVRLFKELQARNAEVTEALQQQTAIAEILRVISSTPTDVMPVLDAVTHRAAQLCDAPDARLFLVEGDNLKYVTGFGELAGALPSTSLTRGRVTGRAILDQSVVHVEDVAAALDEFSDLRSAQQSFGTRTALAVPLLRENQAFGAILMRRKEVRPFTEKQIELVKTFGNQAAIAIENVRLFNEIQDKSRQLEIANKHKSDFLANMSHELRTPLNAIIGFSEVLGERYFGELNEKQAEYVSDIHGSGKHLLSLINDILDLSKIEAGRMELELSEFDLPAALQNALTLVKERAQRHGIKLGLDTDPALGVFRGDERKVKQIMLNLLSNAVKFTPEGGSIAVTARRFDAAVEVSVTDTGVGIAEADHEAVFEEFKQVGRDYTQKTEGTGLGLALTRRFVELHGGAVHVKSAPGKGSTFTFTLPIRHGQ